MHPHANTRALSAAKAAIIHAARRDSPESPETETRRQDSDAPLQEPSARRRQRRAASRARTLPRPRRPRLGEMPTFLLGEVSAAAAYYQLGPEARRKAGSARERRRRRLASMLSKHGALVRSAATLIQNSCARSRRAADSSCLRIATVSQLHLRVKSETGGPGVRAKNCASAIETTFDELRHTGGTNLCGASGIGMDLAQNGRAVWHTDFYRGTRQRRL